MLELDVYEVIKFVHQNMRLNMLHLDAFIFAVGGSARVESDQDLQHRIRKSRRNGSLYLSSEK